MSYQKTLQQARYSLARRIGVAGPTGETTSPSLTVAVLNEFINDSYQETYDILVSRWADYFTLTGSNQTMTPGTASYAVPTDFYKLRKVELAVGSNWTRLLPFDLDAQHLYRLSGTPRRYREQARNIVFAPTPATAETYRLFYIPIRTPLTSDSDVITFDVPQEYKLILTIAWRDCLDAQDLDPSPAIAKIAELTPMLRSAADSRDAAEPFYLDPRGPPFEYLDDDEVGWWY